MTMKKNPELPKPTAPLPEAQKITLSVKDRLVTPQIFPEKGNIISQVIARDLAKKFTIGDAEAKSIELKRMPDGRFTWNGEKTKSVEFELTAPEIAFLKEQIIRVDKTNEVTIDTLGLCQAIQALK